MRRWDIISDSDKTEYYLNPGQGAYETKSCVRARLIIKTSCPLFKKQKIKKKKNQGWEIWSHLALHGGSTEYMIPGYTI